MNIKVLFFGATETATGKRKLDIELPTDTAASSVFDQILNDHPRLAAHRLLFSVNQQYATGDEIIRDGDELAIFTAVSGG